MCKSYIISQKIPGIQKNSAKTFRVKLMDIDSPNGLRLKKRTMHLTNYSVPWILELSVSDAMEDWVVVSFFFQTYLGKIPIFTNIFQMGWNHQPEDM